ncbi:MAG TPA: hypothetical protein DDY17_03900 [Syntrophaceae bacterium]|jgi:hypothetical protein|nr:hypothetical protein [Syntrophaceae bacterium]
MKKITSMANLLKSIDLPFSHEDKTLMRSNHILETIVDTTPYLVVTIPLTQKVTFLILPPRKKKLLSK